MANHLNAFFSAQSDPSRHAVPDWLVRGPVAVGKIHIPHDNALRTYLKHLREQETARSGPEEGLDFNTISDVHVIEALSRVVLTIWLKVGGQDTSVSRFTRAIASYGAG